MNINYKPYLAVMVMPGGCTRNPLVLSSNYLEKATMFNRVRQDVLAASLGVEPTSLDERVTNYARVVKHLRLLRPREFGDARDLLAWELRQDYVNGSDELLKSHVPENAVLKDLIELARNGDFEVSCRPLLV